MVAGDARETAARNHGSTSTCLPFYVITKRNTGHFRMRWRLDIINGLTLRATLRLDNTAMPNFNQHNSVVQ